MLQDNGEDAYAGGNELLTKGVNSYLVRNGGLFIVFQNSNSHINYSMMMWKSLEMRCVIKRHFVLFPSHSGCVLHVNLILRAFNSSHQTKILKPITKCILDP